MTEDKQKLFELQLIDKQLGQLKEHLERLDQQINEVVKVRKQLEEVKSLSGNEEILVPLASGIFASAQLQNNNTVKVNVGEGVVVDKTMDQAIQLIVDQMAQMVQYREQVLGQFNELIQKAEGLAQELQTSQG